jgi:hypothetical protein
MRRLLGRWRLATVWASLIYCAVASHAAEPLSDGPPGLHLPQTQRINFRYVLQDGGGFQWDLQHFGTVGQGTSFAYGGGLYCRVNNGNVSSNGRGWLNESRDEVEIGPWERGELRVWRRIRVYRDQPLARWLDIFENRSDREVTIPVTIYTCTNRQIGQIFSSSGKAELGPKDWAFVTRTEGGDSPLLLHMLCSPGSRVRPVVEIRANQIHVRWSLTIPAGARVVLCYFESQGRSVDIHTKQMREFRGFQALRDLSPAVRALIVNWPGGGGERISLDRSDTADTVIVADDGPKYGRILDESFQVAARFGAITLPAQRVIGMACSPGERQEACFVLTDGQVVSTATPDNALHIELPTGGILQIPFERVDQWSFRVSPNRPISPTFQGPYMLLRTGDRLAFEPDSMSLFLRTMHGRLALDPAELYRLDLGDDGLRLHRAIFLHGSRLCGLLEPATWRVRLRLGAELNVDRSAVAALQLTESEQPSVAAARVQLSNGDDLIGRLEGPPLEVATEFGVVTVDPTNIRKIDCQDSLRPLTRIRLWDSTQLTGSVGDTPLVIRVENGTVVKIRPEHLVRLLCSEALPPAEVVSRARRLIAQLGAESYPDRQKATEELEELGRAIAPILRECLSDARDPEVRRRLEDLLEKIAPAEEQEAPSANPSQARSVAVPFGVQAGMPGN